MGKTLWYPTFCFDNTWLMWYYPRAGVTDMTISSIVVQQISSIQFYITLMGNKMICSYERTDHLTCIVAFWNSSSYKLDEALWDRRPCPRQSNTPILPSVLRDVNLADRKPGLRKCNHLFILPPWTKASITFRCNQFISFWVIMLTNKQASQQSKAIENITSFAREVIIKHDQRQTKHHFLHLS